MAERPVVKPGFSRMAPRKRPLAQPQRRANPLWPQSGRALQRPHRRATLWRSGEPAGTEFVSSWAVGLGASHLLRLRPLSVRACPTVLAWRPGRQLTLQPRG